MGVEIEDSGGSDEKAVAVPAGNSQYRTTDIEMAATLMTIGHKFVELAEKREKRAKRVLFVFAEKMVKEDLTKWLNNELLVEPRALLNNLSDLKNLVHNKGFE